ncbi:hypothetical protein A3D78_01325 [Candidatus Gottesmanbacteria bacterium RIFCSPHIGHO2_02_FULL_39_14]|uniref:Type IV secretion system coupling protein TraD DNA-binding domain-containing protein n=1 Tax=Candidatus Gottesmanbacteria bacterium RIFCSPHIGHO2_02_FULL_39_14 TaxID=1798383 RepID=A0A1F5ZU76_9BACT|nr:MAG: hypothetical protein A3D78_01325 [Candidatus Gottesmanbacteria bacterium RIFCSPHIGHO2_02_FULL_39_14]
MNNLTLFPNFTISDLDRSRNILITGGPGVGMSKYLLDLIYQDITSERPIIIFDRYGDLIEEILSYSAKEIQQKIAYIDLGNKDYPVGLNLFEDKGEGTRENISNFLINLMYNLYDPNRTGVIGPRFEHAVRNAVSTIIYDEKSSFLELLRCLTDSEYVKKVLPKVSDPVVQNYWNKQVTQTSDFHKSEILDYIVSKLSIFVTDKMMRSILCQSKSSINFFSLVSDNKIILFNFGNLRQYSDANKVITSILLYKLMNELKKNRVNTPINLFIDEAVSWPATFITEMLTENRRYGVNLVVTTNKISEANTPLKRTLLKTGSVISFRLSSSDAEIIAPEYHNNKITIDSLCLLKKYHAYIKSLQDGDVVIKDEPVDFKKEHIALDSNKERNDEIKKQSQQKYGVNLKEVEEDIQNRMK